MRSPTTGSADCCARATTGHAAPLPRPTMNSRRRIRDLLPRYREPIPAEVAWERLGRCFGDRTKGPFAALHESLAAQAAPQHVRSWRKRIRRTSVGQPPRP
jgi:hypothetical protein